jgi:16S rRNA G966 N2-methylase RsmD
MFGDIYQSHRDDCPAGDDTPSPHPAVILDPFAGSGTVGMVANRLSRRAILIDLNADYLKQQLQRNAQTPLGLGA